MNTTWLRAALIRAIKTVAQTALAVIGAASVFTEVDWPMIASASGMAGVLSILTSVAGIPEAPAPTERGAVEPGSCALGILVGLLFGWLLWKNGGV